MVEIYADSVIIAIERKVYHIKVRDIVCIEVHDRKTLMITTEEAIVVNQKLSYFKEVFRNFPFSQPHSSYLVHLSYVTYFDDQKVRLRYGAKSYEVHTSQRGYKTFKQDFFNYMESKKKRQGEDAI